MTCRNKRRRRSSQEAHSWWLVLSHVTEKGRMAEAGWCTCDYKKNEAATTNESLPGNAMILLEYSTPTSELMIIYFFIIYFIIPEDSIIPTVIDLLRKNGSAVLSFSTESSLRFTNTASSDQASICIIRPSLNPVSSNAPRKCVMVAILFLWPRVTSFQIIKACGCVILALEETVLCT